MKKLNKHTPYDHFKMEGLFFWKNLYMCKIDLKDAYFFGSPASKISKICKFSMEGPVIPVSMPMFSFGSDFKNIYKTIKNSNSSVEEDDGAANNISQQYSNHGNFNR